MHKGLKMTLNTLIILLLCGIILYLLNELKKPKKFNYKTFDELCDVQKELFTLGLSVCKTEKEFVRLNATPLLNAFLLTESYGLVLRSRGQKYLINLEKIDD